MKPLKLSQLLGYQDSNQVRSPIAFERRPITHANSSITVMMFRLKNIAKSGMVHESLRLQLSLQTIETPQTKSEIWKFFNRSDSGRLCVSDLFGFSGAFKSESRSARSSFFDLLLTRMSYGDPFPSR